MIAQEDENGGTTTLGILPGTSGDANQGRQWHHSHNNGHSSHLAPPLQMPPELEMQSLVLVPLTQGHNKQNINSLNGNGSSQQQQQHHNTLSSGFIFDQTLHQVNDLSQFGGHYKNYSNFSPINTDNANTNCLSYYNQLTASNIHGCNNKNNLKHHSHNLPPRSAHPNDQGLFNYNSGSNKYLQSTQVQSQLNSNQNFQSIQSTDAQSRAQHQTQLNNYPNLKHQLQKLKGGIHLKNRNNESLLTDFELQNPNQINHHNQHHNQSRANNLQNSGLNKRERKQCEKQYATTTNSLKTFSDNHLLIANNSSGGKYGMSSALSQQYGMLQPPSLISLEDAHQNTLNLMRLKSHQDNQSIKLFEDHRQKHDKQNINDANHNSSLMIDCDEQRDHFKLSQNLVSNTNINDQIILSSNNTDQNYSSKKIDKQVQQLSRLDSKNHDSKVSQKNNQKIQYQSTGGVQQANAKLENQQQRANMGYQDKHQINYFDQSGDYKFGLMRSITKSDLAHLSAEHPNLTMNNTQQTANYHYLLNANKDSGFTLQSNQQQPSQLNYANRLQHQLMMTSPTNKLPFSPSNYHKNLLDSQKQLDKNQLDGLSLLNSNLPSFSKCSASMPQQIFYQQNLLQMNLPIGSGRRQTSKGNLSRFSREQMSRRADKASQGCQLVKHSHSKTADVRTEDINFTKASQIALEINGDE